MIPRSKYSVSAIVCRAIIIALLTLSGHFLTGNAFAIQLQLEDSEGVEFNNVLPVEASVVGSLYQSFSAPSADVNYGMDFAGSVPRRMRGMGRRSLTENYKLPEKSNIGGGQLHSQRRSADDVNGKGWPRQRSEITYGWPSKKKNRHDQYISGIQTTSTNIQESKTSSNDRILLSGFEIQESEKEVIKRSLKSRLSGPDSRQDQIGSSRELIDIPNTANSSGRGSNRYDHHQPESKQGTSSTPQSQPFAVSDRSSLYGSDEADLSDIVGLDYDRVRRKPPIHNKLQP